MKLKIILAVLSMMVPSIVHAAKPEFTGGMVRPSFADSMGKPDFAGNQEAPPNSGTPHEEVDESIVLDGEDFDSAEKPPKEDPNFIMGKPEFAGKSVDGVIRKEEAHAANEIRKTSQKNWLEERKTEFWSWWDQMRGVKKNKSQDDALD